MLKSIITFLKLPLSIKFLALEIALELTVACIKLKKYEFKVIAQKLGESGAKQKEFLPQSFEKFTLH